MVRFRAFAVFAAYLSLVVAACNSGGGTAEPTATTRNNEVSATPAAATIAPGTGVAETTTPADVPYTSDWSSGLNGWTGSEGWSVVDSALLNDGTECTGRILAPYFPSDRDYFVEAEVQFIRYDFTGCGNMWGISARSGYTVGLCQNCVDSDPGMFISNGDRDIAEAPHAVDGEWHTYRVEVRSNVIRFAIDGHLVLEATDNKHLDAGRVGFNSGGAQLVVRSVRIESLE